MGGGLGGGGGGSVGTHLVDRVVHGPGQHLFADLLLPLLRDKLAARGHLHVARAGQHAFKVGVVQLRRVLLVDGLDDVDVAVVERVRQRVPPHLLALLAGLAECLVEAQWAAVPARSRCGPNTYTNVDARHD